MASEGSGREYSGHPLTEGQSDPDPLEQFSRWYDQARTLEIDATMMALATATRAGRPSVRNVLLKSVDARGFVFFTN
ncbi:MAG TPA: pyridoxamine 5'-phosphate oxidase family protein, partial [Vicinamibacterales bacterium]|nr:pyridoxamine 5'-phosphate oxidase family protein [Vicinamibacterales bacterium]